MKFLPKKAYLAALGVIPVAGLLYAAPGDVGLDGMTPALTASRSQMLEDYRHVQHLQIVARREKDVIKLNCVNDKLVQLKPQLNLWDRTQAELAGVTDGTTREAIVTELNNSTQRVRQLRQEADQCIGEPVAEQESSNSWTGPTVPDNPYTDWGTVLEPPAYASPFN
jgi:hypothetical protein